MPIQGDGTLDLKKLPGRLYANFITIHMKTSQARSVLQRLQALYFLHYNLAVSNGQLRRSYTASCISFSRPLEDGDIISIDVSVSCYFLQSVFSPFLELVNSE